MTPTTRGDALIADYLDRLAAALRDLPAARRRELLDDIRDHIASARAKHPDEHEADVRNLLERLGTPEQIAASAGVQPPRGRVLEVSALLLLTLGSLIVPVVGWLAGVVLLWLSPIWTRRDKLLGTLLPPFGLGLVSLWIVLGPVLTLYAASSCATVSAQDGTVVSDACQPSAPPILQALLVLGVPLVTLVLSLATAVYLARRLRHASEPQSTTSLEAPLPTA